MKIGKMHIYEKKEVQPEQVIKSLLDAIFLLRVSAKVNQLPEEEKAWKFLKERGYVSEENN